MMVVDSGLDCGSPFVPVYITLHASRHPIARRRRSFPSANRLLVAGEALNSKPKNQTRLAMNDCAECKSQCPPRPLVATILSISFNWPLLSKQVKVLPSRTKQISMRDPTRRGGHDRSLGEPSTDLHLPAHLLSGILGASAALIHFPPTIHTGGVRCEAPRGLRGGCVGPRRAPCFVLSTNNKPPAPITGSPCRHRRAYLFVDGPAGFR